MVEDCLFAILIQCRFLKLHSIKARTSQLLEHCLILWIKLTTIQVNIHDCKGA